MCGYFQAQCRILPDVIKFRSITWVLNLKWWMKNRIWRRSPWVHELLSYVLNYSFRQGTSHYLAPVRGGGEGQKDFGVDHMVFRGSGGGISHCQQSINGGEQKIDRWLTCNEVVGVGIIRIWKGGGDPKILLWLSQKPPTPSGDK